MSSQIILKRVFCTCHPKRFRKVLISCYMASINFQVMGPSQPENLILLVIDTFRLVVKHKIGKEMPSGTQDTGRMAQRLSHRTAYTKVVGSNPLLCTLEKVSLTSSSGRPKPCEGIWVVSLGSQGCHSIFRQKFQAIQGFLNQF